MRPAIFLDRDGTLNVKAAAHQYVTDTEGFVWIPGAREALVELSRRGYVLTVVSNQRGVGRGLMQPAVLDEIEEKMEQDLIELGCRIDAFRYCFHLTKEDCACRKPAPGMIFQLADELDLDLSRSWMIGDSASDVEAGKRAGCHTGWIGPRSSVGAEVTGESLLDIARLIPAAG